jgi:hypothetical protein
VQNNAFTGLAQVQAELARILDALAQGQVPSVVPSPRPSPTSTPTPSSTPVPGPTFTPTPTPSAGSIATRTATPTSTWTPMPSPTLLASLDQPWNVAWQQLPAAWKQRLGSTVAQDEKMACVRQQFEGGFLFWCNRLLKSERTNFVFAVEEQGGNRAWYFEDTPLQPGEELDCAMDLPNLKGGFRKVWCEQKSVREALRLPVEDEWQLYKVQLQDYGTGPGVLEFEGGYMLWDTFASRLWVLIADFGWKSFSIGPGTVTPSPTSTFTATPTPSVTPTPTDTLTPMPTPSGHQTETVADLESYRIIITTGNIWLAGTDAKVFITLFGKTNVNTGELQLDNPGAEFEMGSVDTFVVQARNVGDIDHLRIRHDNSGLGAGWYLEKIQIVSETEGKSWVFPVGRWLAKDEADGKIDLVIYPQQ